jgi:hypothetical protein
MIDKRLSNKDWRINHLYTIVNKNKEEVVFKLNGIQAQLHENQHTRNIVLKARQQGITTYECIDGLDDVLFNRNFTMVIIAHEKDAVKKIFKKIKFAWEKFPADLKAYLGFEASTDSVNELAFGHGSSIRVALSSRSDTVNRLHISEFGKICAKYPLKAEEIITGAIPSVPEGGRIDIESTAEGEFGSFYDMFWHSWNNKPETNKQFKAFFFPWQLNPDYELKGKFEIPSTLREYQSLHKLSELQINWYFIEKQTLKDKMKQENPTTPEEAFEASGFKMFDPMALELQKLNLMDGTKIGDWVIFKPYKPGHRYGIGADVAEGVGQDSSTAKVFDFTENEEVATYKSNEIAPDLFAHELRWAANRYGACLVCSERNNHGHATISTLKTFEEVNIYQEEVFDQVINKRTPKLGWSTNGATKPLMMYELSEAITSGQIRIHDKSTWQELRTYDKQDLSQVRFDSEQTKHWDSVIALAIVWQMRKHATAKETNQELEYDQAVDKMINPKGAYSDLGIPKTDYDEKRAVMDLLNELDKI